MVNYEENLCEVIKYGIRNFHMDKFFFRLRNCWGGIDYLLSFESSWYIFTKYGEFPKKNTK